MVEMFHKGYIKIISFAPVDILYKRKKPIYIKIANFKRYFNLKFVKLVTRKNTKLSIR